MLWLGCGLEFQRDVAETGNLNSVGGSMPEIGRRDIVMLLLGVDPSGEIAEGIGGMTRLQKLLFLLEKEEGLKPSGDGFSFVEYKAGPYSSKLYDDLEFLENLGLIEGRTTAEAT